MSKGRVLLPVCNEKQILAHANIRSSTENKMRKHLKQQDGDAPTQGFFVGWSTNFAKKTDEAAISEGG